MNSRILCASTDVHYRSLFEVQLLVLWCEDLEVDEEETTKSTEYMYKIKGGRQQNGVSGKMSINGQIDTSEIDFQESEMCQVQVITHPTQLPSTLSIGREQIKLSRFARLVSRTAHSGRQTLRGRSEANRRINYKHQYPASVTSHSPS